MRIVTVCQMNQARSPFAQAVLQKNFPEDQITSTGVLAIDGTPILESVIETAKNWGVPVNRSASRSLVTATTDVMEADLIITAENSHRDAIRNLGYSGLIRCYEEILDDSDFIDRKSVV